MGGNLSKYVFQSQGAQGLENEEPEDTSAARKFCTYFAFGMRQLQEIGSTSHGSSSTIDSDISGLEPQLNPTAVYRTQLTHQFETAAAAYYTALASAASQTLGANAAEGTQSILPVGNFRVENIFLGDMLSFSSQEQRPDEIDVQKALAPWRNAALPTNIDAPETLTLGPTTDYEARNNFNVRDQWVVQHSTAPERGVQSGIQPDQPRWFGLQGLSIPGYPTSDDDDLATSASRIGLQAARANEKSPVHSCTDYSFQSPEQVCAEENYGDNATGQRTDHGICGQSVAQACESADWLGTLPLADFDSYHRQSEMLRLPLNRRIVTLPLVVEMRYTRFDPQTLEKFLEIPLVNFLPSGNLPHNRRVY